MKYNLSITLFVFCSFIGKLSSQQVNIQEVKIQQYVKILNPPFQTTDTIRKFSFLVTPEVKPNIKKKQIKKRMGKLFIFM